MSLLDRITALEAELNAATARTADEVEQFRVAMLGRNGRVTALFDDFKQVAAEEKRALGQRMNVLKQQAQQRLDELKGALSQETTSTGPVLDLSAPARTGHTGSLHPITIVRQRIVDIFARMGFTVSQGPEVEDDRHNFSALNFPPDHPARDMQDTFFVKGGDLALRTHTSSVQVRVMEGQRPPIRTISPGRVYRNEAISARAHCMFHQVEALYVDKNVSFADLKGTLDHFTKSLFGAEVRIRMRPSYFPFTEPSAEVDMSCTVCGGSGCNLCKHSGWVEIMGCGMVDPAVLANCDINPEEYSGFALGMGVERITQLIYRVPDLRMYWENDVRFLDQFTAATFRS
ncbi:MAG: phenylalanine--tRNA ligase subunit alpha [Flavobacteriales bacterium]|jgi:phenylalanyl-tRNA synthetase alpha chain|nr:phenylalanine--tRNA ligase subunit alpha [Flavobacteriales bacterium]HOZ40788.1 phenylalanine--tRNA ligase subunit alpha [Flavobacteriales bacterium]